MTISFTLSLVQPNACTEQTFTIDNPVSIANWLNQHSPLIPMLNHLNWEDFGLSCWGKHITRQYLIQNDDRIELCPAVIADPKQDRFNRLKRK